MTSIPIGQSERACLAAAGPDADQLCDLAMKGLVSMFDPQSQLFCFRLKQAQHGLVREGLSHRYTIIALLGLHRLEAAGSRPPIDVRPVLDSLLRDYAWLDNLGDVGLLLWLCAVVYPERLIEVYSGLRVETALVRFRDARRGYTTELAWFLSGLAHASMALPQQLPGLRDLAVQTYGLLADNQGCHGIFGHMARRRSMAGALRGHIGSFADQVYPIVALTAYAQVSGDAEALHRAKTCGEAIRREQGPLGQWWWHYDSSTGTTIGRYPVYSVHQDGMAPMALLALGQATQRDLSGPVYKGLEWISGSNELQRDLRDRSTNVIWRSIHPGGKYKTYVAGALDALGWEGNNGVTKRLSVNLECRPYHFGWLLYAFADHRKLCRTL